MGEIKINGTAILEPKSPGVRQTAQRPDAQVPHARLIWSEPKSKKNGRHTGIARARGICYFPGVMICSHRYHRIGWLLVACFAVVAQAGEPFPIAPQNGVLVLRTGAVLPGQVSRVGDRFLVEMVHGEVRVRAEAVEFFSSSLDEAYRRKRAALNGNRADEHLDLAAWCLRQGLPGYAAREFLRASQLEPHHRRLPLIERQIELAKRKASEMATENVADGELDLEPEPDVPRLSGAAMETFTQTVQPLLLNRCSNAGCHSAEADNRLRLGRIGFRGTLTRRQTHRNLAAVLACIDQQQPAQSPLLAKPLMPHGDAEVPIFGQQDLPKYQQLVQWVEMVSAAKLAKPAQPPTVNSDGAGPLLQKLAAQQESSVPAGSRNRSSTNRADAKGQDSPAANSMTRRRGQLPSRATAVDPFDPDAFNMQD